MAAVEACLISDAVQQEQAPTDSASSSGGRVAAWDDTQEWLKHVKFAWKAQAPAEMFGVNPQNRSRLGESHHHALRMKAVFSKRNASDATALEAPPPPYNVEAIKFNERLVAMSAGMIPPF